MENMRGLFAKQAFYIVGKISSSRKIKELILGFPATILLDGRYCAAVS